MHHTPKGFPFPKRKVMIKTKMTGRLRARGYVTDISPVRYEPESAAI
jgi:hypothetical protein|tara:strand:- start:15630 stop:15770 length:141 start_codon:yes stop_codon:yes gene_type:complete